MKAEHQNKIKIYPFFFNLDLLLDTAKPYTQECNKGVCMKY